MFKSVIRGSVSLLKWALCSVGVLAALAFASFGVSRVQSAPVSLGARILILPGAAALWPYVLTRWLTAVRR